MVKFLFSVFIVLPVFCFAQDAYRFNCEVHGIVDVYFSGITANEDNQERTSNLTVVIIDYPIVVNKELIQKNVFQKQNRSHAFTLDYFENAERFVKIKATGNQAIVNMDFGSVMLRDKRAYCTFTPVKTTIL